MKKTFLKTQNVKKFVTMMNNLENRPENVSGLALVHGAPGLGKTQTINWWAFQNDALLIRCNKLMNGKWLLTEILNAMDEQASRLNLYCFNRIIQNLLIKPRTMIVDEIDYLLSDPYALETLRDIHDKTNIPIVFVGMNSANTHLKKYKHIYDRLFEIVKFEPFTLDDVVEITKELSEIEITDTAITKMHKNVKRFRQLVKIINKCELFAKANGVSAIDEIIIEEIISQELNAQPVDLEINIGEKTNEKTYKTIKDSKKVQSRGSFDLY